MNIIFLKKLYEKYKLHLIFWSVFIAYEVLITGLFTGKFSKIETYIFHYSINIFILYLHAYGLLKLYNKKNKLSLILLFSLFELALYILLCIGIAIFINMTLDSSFDTTIDKSFITRALWRCLYFIGFGTGYFYIKKSFIERKRSDELERENLTNTIEKQALENDLIQSQNNFLRSQINPHFLFNTLNFIYNDARKKAPLAADAIMNLAEMMRYALKRNDNSNLVAITEEIEQIEHLINLHNLRTAGALNVELNINDDLFGIKFPPLILLTLVENIFKHGNISHSTQAAEINISLENGILKILTVNIVNAVKARESTKVGLENIHKRLANVYKDNYTFECYEDNTNRYFTKISVPQTLVN
jgi:two-component system LytT family sensor kinase